MRTNKNIKLNKKRKIFFLFISIFFLNVSCNEDVENKLQSNYSDADFNQDAGAVAHGKVLYIVIDGVQGETIRTVAPPNIMGLTNNAIYSFSGLADAATNRMTEATGWANLLTGVTSNLHQVKSEDFSGNKLEQYPSIVSLTKKTRPELKTVLFATSALFSNYFSKDFDAINTFNNDNQAAATAVSNELQNNNSDLVLAQFNAAKIAGDNFGYSSNQYRDAILSIDTYIGNLMTTLKARPNYKKENWMVVVTTSTGGQLSTNKADLGPFDDSSRNTFILFYNYRFNSKIIQKPSLSDIKYTGYGVTYSYVNTTFGNATLNNTSLYDLGTTGAMTVQFMMKNKTGSFSWPTILSKRAADFSGNGWNIFLSGTSWGVNSRMGSEIKSSKVISDDKWHVLTVVFDRGGGTRNTITMYTDGVKSSSTTNTTTNLVMTNAAPLRIGRIPTSGVNTPEVMITNLQIYNRAFSDADVASLSCLPIIKNTHPYYNDLIGYWPGDEVDQTVLKERTHKLGALVDADFRLTGTYVWKDFSEVSSSVCPEIPDYFFRLIPNSSDVSLQVLQWLGVRIYDNWNLDGHGWSLSYKDIVP